MTSRPYLRALFWMPLLTVLGIGGGSACTPRITVLDRQTILEEEAAGEWPQFDAKLINPGPKRGATLYPSTPASAKKTRLYSTLSGEMTQ